MNEIYYENIENANTGSELMSAICEAFRQATSAIDSFPLLSISYITMSNYEVLPSVSANIVYDVYDA